MTHFLRYHTFDPLLSFEPKMLRTHFFITFPGKKRSNWKKKENCCGHQLQTMTHFLRYHTFDPLLSLEPTMLRTHFFTTFPGKEVK